MIELAIVTYGRELNLATWEDIIIHPNSLGINADCRGNACNEILTPKRNVYSKRITDTHRIPMDLFPSQNPWQWFCPCESEYNIVDLGPGNYPRYIATANCTPKPCHGKFNQCKLIHYKVSILLLFILINFIYMNNDLNVCNIQVHILRQRDLSDGENTNDEQYIEPSILPESLSVQWQLQPMKIAVACIAAIEGRKN